MSNLIQDLPRQAVETHLQLTRLPLTAFEAVARRGQDNDEWGPAIAFEGYEARVRELVGSLVNDEELLSQARLQRARLTQLQRAAEKEAEARAKAADAQDQLQARQQAAEQQRQRVEQQAEERERQLERQKTEARQKVEREFAQREQASERIEDAQQKAVAKRQTAADRKRLQAEADALAEKDKAVQAKAEVIELDQAVENTKQRRRAARA